MTFNVKGCLQLLQDFGNMSLYGHCKRPVYVIISLQRVCMSALFYKPTCISVKRAFTSVIAKWCLHLSLQMGFCVCHSNVVSVIV